MRRVVLASLSSLLMATSGCVSRQPSLAKASVEVLVDGQINGSGCIVDAKGTILTASHVVSELEDKTIELLWQGERCPAEYVARDSLHDLALLRLPSRPAPYPFLQIAKDIPAPGSPVVLYGSAQFDHGLRFHGQVSRPAHCYRYFGKRQGFMRCWLVNSFSPPGTSGAPWLYGDKVVGVQSGFLNYRKSSMSGLALVAPPDAIRDLVATQKTPEYPALGCGIEELWSQSPGFIARFPKGSEGLITVPMEEDGPAVQAGLDRESLVLAVNGTPVRYRNDLVDILYQHRPGDVLEIKFLAPDTAEPRTVSVTLGTMP